MSVQRYRRKPEKPREGDVTCAARWTPGEPLDDVLAVARMADPDARVASLAYASKMFPRLAGPRLVVASARVPDERPAELDITVVAAGEYLCYSQGYDMLYECTEDNWRSYELLPE